MKKLIIIIGFMMMFFTGCTGNESTPEEIVKSYFKAAIKSNLDEANSFYSKQTTTYTKVKNYKNVNGFNKWVEDNNSFILKTEVKKVNDNLLKVYLFTTNETAKTDYLKEYKKSRGSICVLVLSKSIFEIIKESGSWKIKQ